VYKEWPSKDLKLDNFLVVSSALTAVCKLINDKTILAMLPQVIDLLGHPKEHVRKKVVMALHRFHQRSPSSVAHLLTKFRQVDSLPSVEHQLFSLLRKLSLFIVDFFGVVILLSNFI
jgi:AP-4 complex subunit epsilon-1